MNKAYTLSYTRDLHPDARQRVPGRSRVQQQPDCRPAQRPRGHQLAWRQRSRAGAPVGQRAPEGRVPGTALQGLSQVDWRNPGFLNRSNQVQNQTTWLRGTHSLKVGAEVRRVDWEDLNAPPTSSGTSTSTAGSRGSGSRGERPSVCRFPVRRAEHGARAFPPVPALRSRWTYDFFAQDDWKVTRNLTVNLGLRYDIHPGWYERNGRLAMFDLTSGKIVVPEEGPTRCRRSCRRLRRRRHRQQSRLALARAGADRPQQHRAAPRLCLSAVRRRQHRSSAAATASTST